MTILQDRGSRIQGPDDKRGNTMNLYFRVRTVVLTQTQTQLTLDPVEWLVATETDAGGNETEWRDATPDEAGTAPFEPGGKTTELRLDGRHAVEPGEFYTLTVEQTETVWTP